MGVDRLFQIVEKASSKSCLNDFSGCTAGVDARGWIYRGAYANATKLARGIQCDGHVKYVVSKTEMLLKFGIKPIMVFDGNLLPIKSATNIKRKNSKEANKRVGDAFYDRGDKDGAEKHYRECIEITTQMTLDVIQALYAINVDAMIAPYEADAQLAYLSLKGIAQFIISEDSDLILFGCNKLFSKIDKNGNGIITELDKIKSEFRFNGEENFQKFRWAAILSGCDYLENINGIGWEKALKIVSIDEKNIASILPQLPRILKRVEIKVSPLYIDNFIKADNTFKYQLVFDVLTRQLVPLNTLPHGKDMKDFSYAGSSFDNPLEHSLGNLLIPGQKKFEPKMSARPANFYCKTMNSKKAHLPKIEMWENLKEHFSLPTFNGLHAVIFKSMSPISYQQSIWSEHFASNRPCLNGFEIGKFDWRCANAQINKDDMTPPSIVDGLTPGNRKIIFSAGKESTLITSHYHGSTLLRAAHLAQSFVGVNNINFIACNVQTGTSHFGGDNAELPTQFWQSELAPFIFREEDIKYLKKFNGQPEWLCPVVPTLLINGALGIGKDWKLQIPNFNPYDVVANIKRMIAGDSPIAMTPYYKNFKGSIEVVNETTFRTSGVVSIIGENSIEITELPISVYTQSYKDNFLEPACQNGKIESFAEFHSDSAIRFTIKMTNLQFKEINKIGFERFFKLVTWIKIKDMYLLNNKGDMCRFKTINEIFYEFFKIRLSIYEKRVSNCPSSYRFTSIQLKEAALKLWSMEIEEFENCDHLKRENFQSPTNSQKPSTTTTTNQKPTTTTNQNQKPSTSTTTNQKPTTTTNQNQKPSTSTTTNSKKRSLADDKENINPILKIKKVKTAGDLTNQEIGQIIKQKTKVQSLDKFFKVEPRNLR